MADRKPTATKSTKSTQSAKPHGASRSGAASAQRSSAAGRKRPSSTSIVNQRQTPWMWIIVAVVVVLAGGGLIGYIATRPSGSSEPSASTSNDPYRQPALPDAMKIHGVTYKQEPNHTHVLSGTVNYDATPPVGGNHSPIWADCSGTVYPNAIANENAVHALEHGAIWITYKPGLAADQVATLSKLVDGQDRMLMSPYPGLSSNISLQAWGYQLKVANANDPRITQFIDTLRYNPKTTPEYGAQCADPQFKANPSTFGNPIYTLS